MPTETPDPTIPLVDAIADTVNDRGLLITGRVAGRLEVFAGVFSRRRQDLGEMLSGRSRLLFVEGISTRPGRRNIDVTGTYWRRSNGHGTGRARSPQKRYQVR